MRIPTVAALVVALFALPPASLADILQFRGTCDGSGAVVLPDGSIATVDDEKEPKLRIFNLHGGEPTVIVSIPGISDTDVEPDLEAGTRVGNMSLWIGSHSRNRDGEYRPERQILLGIPMDAISARTIGVSAVRKLDSLRSVLVAWGTRYGIPMAEAFGPEDQKVKRLAPERRGVNIEAMAYDLRNHELLIGFRNPVPGGQSLIAPLRNVDAVLRGETAEFGPPVRLLLGGRGLRDMVWSERHRALLLVAGPSGDEGTFALYRWSGAEPMEVPWATALPDGFHPETVLALPDTDSVLMLSDDGDVAASRDAADCKPNLSDKETGSCTCKNIRKSKADQLRLFRGIKVSVPAN